MSDLSRRALSEPEEPPEDDPPAAPPRASAPRALRRLAAPALLAAATIAAYSNAVTPTFQLDDHAAIVRSGLLRDPATFLDPFAAYRAGGPAALARFVANASFAIDALVWGGDRRGFHVTNVLVHLGAVLLVYALVLELFRTPRLAASRLAPSARAIALASALLFALHPVQTQAVTYVVQRMTSLATVLGLAGVVAWLRFRRGTGASRLAWLAAATLATALAMVTKEIAFTFPVLAALAEILFLEGPARKRLLGLAPLVATMAIVPAIVLAGAPVADRISVGGEAGLATLGLGRGEYLLTQARVLVTYLRLMVLPAGQNLFPDYPISRALTVPVAASIALHLAAIGGSAAVAWISRRRAPERSLVAYGVLWFYAALSVESLAVVLVDVYNEHRLYYPSVGLLVAATAACALVAGLPAAGRLRAWGPALLAAVALALGIATFARNRVWADEVTMWEDVAAKSPAYAVVQRMVGVALLRQGRAVEAVPALRRAIGLDPFSAHAWEDLARAHRAAGDEVRSAHARAAVQYLRFDFAGALSLWDAAVRRSPGTAAFHHGRAIALRALGKGAEADEESAVACRLGSERACAGGMRLPDP